MKYIKFQMYRGEGREETWFFFLTFKFMLCKKSFKNAGLGIRSLVFCANHSCFANKWANEPFAHFWWATWTICSHSSFLVSDLSDSLPSLIKKEGMSESQIFLNKKKNYIKHTKNKILDFSAKIFWANRSFDHLSWAICSRLFICLEWPERFAYSRSFVMSDLSDSFTVAHFICAKWANEQWANERSPSPEKM